MLGATLQGGLFYEPTPARLPVWLMVGGATLLVAGGLSGALEQHPTFGGMDRDEHALTVALLTVGFLLLSLSVLRGSLGAYSLVLFLGFRVVEGAALFRFYHRAGRWVLGRSAGGSGRRTGLLLYGAVAFSAGTVGVGLLLQAAAPALLGRYGYAVADPRTAYTVATLSMAVVGVHHRLAPAVDWPNGLVVSGFALSVAGAELFGFGSLAAELAVLAAGAVAHALGFWSVVALWLAGAAGLRSTP